MSKVKSLEELMETEDMVDVDTVCPICGNHHKVTVVFEDWYEYYYSKNDPNRRFIQDIFPYLSNNDREMLKTGICNNCWYTLFPDPDDEDEDEDY